MDHLLAAFQDNLKLCCEKDGRSGAAHCYHFLQLVPTGRDFLYCVVDMEVIEVLSNKFWIHDGIKKKSSE